MLGGMLRGGRLGREGRRPCAATAVDAVALSARWTALLWNTAAVDESAGTTVQAQSPRDGRRAAAGWAVGLAL